MKQRPILFSGPMVRAILESRKTVTRRVVKLNDAGRVKHAGKQWHVEDPAVIAGCPYGQPGDRLWVRESCRAYEIPDADYDGIHHPEPGTDGVRYQADDAFREIENTQEASDAWLKLWGYRGGKGEWVRSIHMPRWASRITLEVTGVRVERLQEISEADSLAEGTSKIEWELDNAECPDTHTDAYRLLWESINGPDSWTANPWVWVVEFKRVA